MHKSGFVNIIGNPNMGKSTLMNALARRGLYDGPAVRNVAQAAAACKEVLA